jgi:guanine deaminase
MQAFRASLLHCLADPGEASDQNAWEYVADGLLVVDDGRVKAVGEADALLPALPAGVEVMDYRDKLIVPGFIDCHVHFPQLDIIGSFGAQLLDWLNQYAYPAEMRFADPDYAREVAAAFIDELLRNGTTTALVFGTVHAHSADAIFEAAEAKGLRLIAGKVLMDRNCPEALRDDPDSAYADSSEAQLEAAGRLAAEHPDVWVHTHLAENREEVEQIARQFPESRSYLDVYDRFGLLRERSVFAHCLHMGEQDRATMAKKGGSAAFCPTSNLFLGSGLFRLGAMRAAGIRCGLGTDVGGGTSLSLLRTASEAYKVLHLQEHALPAMQALYLATLGAAEALHLDEDIGNFVPGKEADFAVLDFAGSNITARRTAAANSIEEKLFALMTLGDDRNIAGTYVLGRRA